MTTLRLYTPLTEERLRALAADFRLDRSDDVAFTVTDAVRAAYPDDDEEDLEYAALWAAADAARRDRPTARVVVVAVDAPAAAVRPAGPDAPGTVADDEAYAVYVGADITLAQVVSLHVEAAGADQDEELDWYDVSELADVVDAS